MTTEEIYLKVKEIAQELQSVKDPVESGKIKIIGENLAGIIEIFGQTHFSSEELKLIWRRSTKHNG